MLTSQQILAALHKIRVAVREKKSKQAIGEIDRLEDQLRERPAEPPPPKEEPSPPPPPPPPPPTGEKPWLRMIKKGDWHYLHTTGNDIVDVDDGIQITTPDSHQLVGYPRNELQTDYFLKAGTDFWIRTAFYFTQSIVDHRGWATHLSVYNRTGGSGGPAPWHLSTVDGKFGWQSPGGSMVWSKPAVAGAWTEVLHHHKNSSNATLETFLRMNGQGDWQLADKRVTDATMPDALVKACNNHDDTGTTTVLKVGPTLIGPSRASVGG